MFSIKSYLFKNVSFHKPLLDIDFDDWLLLNYPYPPDSLFTEIPKKEELCLRLFLDCSSFL
jgi:hypothetical protein